MGNSDNQPTDKPIQERMLKAIPRLLDAVPSIRRRQVALELLNILPFMWPLGNIEGLHFSPELLRMHREIAQRESDRMIERLDKLFDQDPAEVRVIQGIINQLSLYPQADLEAWLAHVAHVPSLPSKPPQLCHLPEKWTKAS